MDDTSPNDNSLDADGIREIEQQLIDGHSYPCALDMWNLRAIWGEGRRQPYPRRWLYGRRYLRRSFLLGRQDGTTLIAVMLN